MLPVPTRSWPQVPRTALGALFIAITSSSWGCTENFSASDDDGLDGSTSTDATRPEVDGEDGDIFATGSEHDTALADGALSPDAVRGDATLDRESVDAALDASVALDADMDSADAGHDAEDGAHDASDGTIEARDAASDAAALDANAAADAGDGAIPPALAVTGGSVSVAAMCNGANGTLPQPAAQFLLTNRTTRAVGWTATAMNGTVTVSPSSSTLAASASTFVSVTAVALTGYPPAPTLNDTIGIVANTGSPPLAVPVVESFQGYFFSPLEIDFGLVPRFATVTQHVSAMFTGTCCQAGSANFSAPPFQAVTTLAPISGIATDIAVEFTPTTLAKSTTTFQFTGATAPVCTPPILLTGTGAPDPGCMTNGQELPDGTACATNGSGVTEAECNLGFCVQCAGIPDGVACTPADGGVDDGTCLGGACQL